MSPKNFSRERHIKSYSHENFFSFLYILKNPSTSVGIEFVNFGSRGKFIALRSTLCLTSLSKLFTCMKSYLSDIVIWFLFTKLEVNKFFVSFHFSVLALYKVIAQANVNSLAKILLFVYVIVHKNWCYCSYMQIIKTKSKMYKYILIG